MKRKSLFLVILILISLLLTACTEDTATLERNLYYDMEGIYRYAFNFLDEYVDGMRNQTYDVKLLKQQIDSMKKSVAKLKPPKHLKSEVNEWKGHIEDAIVVFERMMDGDSSALLTPNQVEALDHGMERIYNGFKEYEWK